MKTEKEIKEVLKAINEHIEKENKKVQKELQIEKQTLLWVLGAGTLSEIGKSWLEG